MEQYPNMAGMWVVGEDMPRATNRVTLHDSEKDKFGMPIPNVTSTTTRTTSPCAATP